MKIPAWWISPNSSCNLFKMSPVQMYPMSYRNQANVDILENITQGGGRGRYRKTDRHWQYYKTNGIGLGQTAPNPVLTTINSEMSTGSY